MTLPFTLRLRLVRLLPLLAVACLDSDRLATPESSQEPIARLVLTPERVATGPSGQVVFDVVGLTASGDTAPISVVWAAKRGTVAGASGVDPSGRGKGKKVGHYKADNTTGQDTVIVDDTSGVADTAIVDVEPEAVAAVDVAPATAALVVGAAVQLTATPRDSAGNALTGRQVLWSTSDGDVATVSSSGLVTGASAGSATITATSEGQSGTATVTVTNVPVASVAVSPASASVQVGATVQLSATVADADGNALTGRSVTWSSSATGVATVSSSGLVTGVAAGSATITATSEGQSGTATVTVTSVPAASVTVSPASASVQVGATVQLSATVADADGNALTGRSVTWSSSATGVATVSSSGVVTGVAAGSATITATSGGQSGTATVTVTNVPVASVAVSPPSASVQVGATVQLSATVADADGNALTGRSVTWSSSATGVATVSSSGLVTGVAAGSATITATSEGRSGSASITVTAPPPPTSGSVVFVGAGDIAGSGSGDEATAQLLDQAVAAGGASVTVFTAGDNAYPDGTASEFAAYYDPTWGRHKARTRPSPGNHDYHTSSGSDYYEYFGSLAGPAGRGYYSYDLGAWHIISLNSNVSMSAGSAQEQWLRSDLAATTKQCVLAYWHHPRFSSSSNHGSSTGPRPLYQALYDFNAEVIVVGHDHTYERFAPQDANGTAAPSRGIRQFVVGTGGRSLYDFGSPEPNSEVRYNSTYGVIKFTLSAGGYNWEFVPVSGSFRDSGSGSCH